MVVLPPPEEILIGEVVQFNAGAGCAGSTRQLGLLSRKAIGIYRLFIAPQTARTSRYGFIKPGPHGIFQCGPLTTR